MPAARAGPDAERLGARVGRAAVRGRRPGRRTHRRRTPGARFGLLLVVACGAGPAPALSAAGFSVAGFGAGAGRALARRPRWTAAPRSRWSAVPRRRVPRALSWPWAPAWCSGGRVRIRVSYFGEKSDETSPAAAKGGRRVRATGQ
ncbi:hypothetical protein GCM10020295_66270 [Streptomyces cinereospinus]